MTEQIHSAPVVVPADVSRWNEPMRTTGEKVWVKVSGKDTEGA